MKNKNIRQGNGNNSCLEKVDGVLKLKTNHPYFYQVQTQSLVSGMDYCEFIVWTEQDLFDQRITPCTELQQSLEQKSAAFFKTVVLLELVGKHFSKLTVIDNEPRRKAKISQKPKKSLSTQSTTFGLTNLTSSNKEKTHKEEDCPLRCQ